MSTFSRWIATPENRSAFEAVRRVAASPGDVNPLLIHGPSGVGKTHLTSALAAEVAALRAETVIEQTTARALGEALLTGPEPPADVKSAHHSDLLIVEDVQHLPPAAATAFGRLLDFRCARRRQVVLTCNVGPSRLTSLPVRLTSRLTNGLVVGMEGYGPASRYSLLETMTKRRRLTIAPDVLAWLADHMAGSGRQLEGAVVRVEALLAVVNGPVDVVTVAAHFDVDNEPTRPALESLVESVGRYFNVLPGDLTSQSRERRVLLPRQVAMYLARRFLPLSLAEVGAFFGGRDHSTVLHACRKVEEALTHDASLNAAVLTLSAQHDREAA